ncbi:DUF445 family protein [Heliorestis acidaminivorans]|uniref:DUF445 family protein n=1 Tax=Heliorestis acidaminivorans TaxID=553427 RepID=A0A6I0ENZ8_9FIRM|nr:DUF445 family protein [Heliorestis acidaminivorans]KAB2951551.1 DUF445 family protein [Heliorestis acidaminivorans]
MLHKPLICYSLPMITIDLYFMPIIGAIIGWVTNILAVSMLFRPYHPIQLPLLPWVIQGLIPRRQEEMAIKIGEVVEEQLLSQDDLMARINTTETREKLSRSLAEVISARLGEKVPSFLPLGIRQIVTDLSRDLVNKEAPAVLDRMAKQLETSIKEHVSVREIVEDRIRSLDLVEMEQLVLRVASKELRHIVILGGALGFIVGLVQALISYGLRSWLT